MGFSVSGAAAIIFAALFVAFGAWYTATANNFERVQAAQEARTDTVLETRNARINITSASHSGSTLTVTVENTGAAQLTLNGTDLLVDGRYVSDWQADATVAGDGGTDLWLSGETVDITIDRSTAPDHVKIVVANGVSDTKEVT